MIEHTELVETLTSNFRAHDVHGNEILSFDNPSVTYRSYTKDRIGNVSSVKPYIHTLDYDVTRFDGQAESSSYVIVYTAEFGGGDNVKTGMYAAVSRDAAMGFLYTPQLSALADELAASAWNAALDQLGGEKFNTLVFLAELNKSTDLVTSFAQKVDRGTKILMSSIRRPAVAFRQMKKAFGKYSRGFKAPNGTGSVAKLWLLWRYAVQTAMLDVQNAARTAASLLRDNESLVDISIMIRRSGAVDLGVMQVSDESWGRQIGINLSLGSNVTHTLSRVGQVHAHAWIKANRRNSFLADANQLGLLNLASAAWELTPLSFVADWILDIGSYLERASAAIGVDIIDAGTDVLRKVGGQHGLVINSIYGVVSRDFSGEAARYESSSYIRRRKTDYNPVWTPAFRMSTNRWLDAAALIRSIPMGRMKVF